MDGELEKAYLEYLDSVVVFKINIEDAVRRITGAKLIWIHVADYNFMFDVDGSVKISKSQIKEIEQSTGASFIGKYCDYCFEYMEEE